MGLLFNFQLEALQCKLVFFKYLQKDLAFQLIMIMSQPFWNS